MRIALCDYSGHPFQVQLSRELARRGHDLLHLYFGGFQTPHGRLTTGPDDPPGLAIESVGLDEPFAKYSLIRRRVQEGRIGRRLAARIASFRPDLTIGCNLPLDALAIVSRAASRSGVPFVFWQQDVYSRAITRILTATHGLSGRLLGAYYSGLEGRVARASAAIVAIADDFVPVLHHQFGVDPRRIHVVENWAPLAEITPRPKDTPWSRAHDLAGREVVLYTGTLGLKHDPAQLLAIARHLRHRALTTVLVVSEGPAAAWLAQQGSGQGLSNLRVLPFQPFDVYADVLGCADVLVSILGPDAGTFSVPSKVLSYLCAGRPIAISAPLDNLAARTVDAARAGVVVPATASFDLAREVGAMLDDPARRRLAGFRGRRHAERHFAIDRIADRFELIMEGALAIGPKTSRSSVQVGQPRSEHGSPLQDLWPGEAR